MAGQDFRSAKEIKAADAPANTRITDTHATTVKDRVSQVNPGFALMIGEALPGPASQLAPVAAPKHGLRTT